MPEILVPFQQIDVAPSLDGFAYFVGTRDNNDGSFTDYRFTYAQIIAAATGSAKQLITCGIDYSISTVDAPNDTLSGPYFFNPIQFIIANGGAFILGSDFTQDTVGQSIKWINGAQFQSGQKIIVSQ